MRSILSRLRHDESGGVLILVGLYIGILLGLIGIALNTGDSVIIKTRMQNAADAAALAAVADSGLTNAQRSAIARRYFALNYPEGFLATELTAADITVSPSATQVEVNAQDVRSTYLTTVLDPSLDKATVRTRSVVSTSGNTVDMDLVMVMDASKSMQNFNRIQGAYEAAQETIDSVLRAPGSDSRIAWVQYTLVCWTDPNAPFPRFCRSNGAAPITSQPYTQPPYWQAFDFNRNAAALDRINTNYRNFVLNGNPGGTNGSDGLRAARDMLSRNSRAGTAKAVIYMTDGISNVDSRDTITASPPHALAWDSGLSQDTIPTEISRRILAECDGIKNDRALLFVVGLGAEACDASATTVTTMENCATDPSRYVCARTNDELKQIFRDIITTTKNVRVAQ